MWLIINYKKGEKRNEKDFVTIIGHGNDRDSYALGCAAD